MIDTNLLFILIIIISFFVIINYSNTKKWYCSDKGCEYNINKGQFINKKGCEKDCENKEDEDEQEKDDYSYVCTTDNRCQKIKGSNGTFKTEGDCLQSCFNPYFPRYYPQSMLYPYDNLYSPYYFNRFHIRRKRKWPIRRKRRII